MYFLSLPVSNHIVNTTAKEIPVNSEPIIKPTKQALHVDEHLPEGQRLEKKRRYSGNA
jgi:hypothetical protein